MAEGASFNAIKHSLKPHRLDRYMASDDPEFESKAADILGLYLYEFTPISCTCFICSRSEDFLQEILRLLHSFGIDDRAPSA
jgi:hypothetical protein